MVGIYCCTLDHVQCKSNSQCGQCLYMIAAVNMKGTAEVLYSVVYQNRNYIAAVYGTYTMAQNTHYIYSAVEPTPLWSELPGLTDTFRCPDYNRQFVAPSSRMSESGTDSTKVMSMCCKIEV